MQLTISTFS